MSFPNLSLAIFLAFPAAALLVWQIFARRGRSLGFSSVGESAEIPKSIRQHFLWLPNVLRILAVVALLIAIARPQVDRFESSVEREGVAIELLVDISSSMDMRMRHSGRETSRLNVAKSVIHDFIIGSEEDELDGRPDDLVGMVTFARYADTICPLTLSHDMVTYLTDELVINDRPNEDGTAYGDATALAAARLSSLEDRLDRGDETGPSLEPIASKIIVLLTDGENNCGRTLPLQAAALAKAWGIKIYTISLTDPPKSQFVRVDDNTTIEASRVRTASEQALERMAEMTGGIFRTAHDFDTLKAVYKEIDSLEQSRMRSTLRRVPGEVFTWFAFTALLILALEHVLRCTWLRQIP
ncbi:MAG: Ca-activated chloride channel family protein [Verrucomicrobiales bacterium]|jgi:Ca-activated chloride channel family protein